MNKGRGFGDDVIVSLGQTLSSVNIAGSDAERGGSGEDRVQGGYGAPGTVVVSSPSESWGAAPAGLSYAFYGNNTGSDKNQHSNSVNGSNISELHHRHQHDPLQNILYDSGIYESEEISNHRASSVSNRSSTPPPVINSDRERKPSIDVFLSQSPSKALGEDAFRVMNRTTSNPSLVNLYPVQRLRDNNCMSKNDGLKPLSSTAPSSRSESPQAIRSTSMTVGNGGSPYSNINGGQVIPSQFANNATVNNYSPQHQQQHSQLHAQLRQQPFPGFLNNGEQQHPFQLSQQPQPQYVPMPVAQQQPQVFYMAVPAPDGKGQVLQPVQMVQMPGQAGALMMPMAAGINGNQQVDVHSSQGQSMMLMQTIQANNDVNSMYGQDIRGSNSGGSNNQYAQYSSVIQQQQSVGYDNRYSKNTSVDNLGGAGQYQNDQSGNIDQGLDGSLSMLYSSPECPPLRTLLGNVRRLSRDQVGCRLLQQALDKDGPTAATAILNEGLSFWAEAMVDPFGNYLFQKILERITPDERVTLVNSVSTRLVNASLNLHGTRSVQKIVEVCALDETNAGLNQDEKKEEEKGSSTGNGTKNKETASKILTDALKPSAARLCIDSHGNHAIQRILLKLPYQYTQFIFDAVAASVEDVARHRHGCCVIQRCLDSRHSAARTHLVTRIVEKSLELMQDAYGNYVVQYVLDVCGDDEVHAVCESVMGKVCILAVQKFSSNVMEKCLERCTDRVREDYLNELNDSDRIRELMMDPFGNYVVQRALSVSTHAQAIRLVETMKPHLSSQNGGGSIRNTAGGRRILGKICRRFPNFVMEGETFEDYDLNQVLARESSQQQQQGGGRRQNQFGMHHQHPGPSPTNQRRNSNRGRNQHPHAPQYQQQLQLDGHHVNVQQSEMNVIPTYQNQGGGNPYLFPLGM